MTSVLPPALLTGPFTTAQARDAGIGRGTLSGPGVQRLLRGVYVAADTEITDVVRCRALRLVMPPDAAVCGLTAAWVHGAWRPPPSSTVPLELARPLRAGPLVREGVDGSRHRLREDHLIEISGVCVESSVRTAVDLMRRGALVESVVVADMFAARGCVELWQLGAELGACRRWPYVVQARVALQLADSRSGSPGETRLRMVPVLAGLPRPLVNVPVTLLDARYGTGALLGTPDLLLHGPHGWALAEFDGSYHDEGDQPRLDRARQNRLGSIPGTTVLRYDRATVGSHPQRQLALSQLCAATGLAPTNPLRALDWHDPRRPFRW